MADVRPPTLSDSSSFHSMGLDDRLRKAISRLAWDTPTIVQAEAVPLALQGKDILARARTGSGKTGAYAVPIVQKILSSERFAVFGEKETTGCRALVLVPTRELVEQARQVFSALTQYAPHVKTVALAADIPVSAQKSLLSENPQIVIATPARLAVHLKSKHMTIRESLEMVVIDEADLLFSYGHAEDLKLVTSHLPNICQAFLMSATLTQEVENLKKLVLHNPIVLKLEEKEEHQQTLAQYSITCAPNDKFLICLSLIKLSIIPGKTLFFVNDITKCYQLKLFFEQFALKSAVLNSELPQNSRMHIIDQFNRGVFKYLIATDESFAVDDEKAGIADGDDQDQPSENIREDFENPKKKSKGAKPTEESGNKKKGKKHAAAAEEEGGEGGEGEESKTKKRKKKRQARDGEYGVSRGVDFQNVETVINFDLPLNNSSYVHRIGRTARAGKSGSALSLISPKEQPFLEKLILWQRKNDQPEVVPLPFNRSEIEGFRYRCEDALGRVTRLAVKRARVKEVELELVNAESLRAHFQENPRDLDALKHDTTLTAQRVPIQLKHVPEYIVPAALKSHVSPASRSYQNSNIKNSKVRAAELKKAKKADPLKTFRFKDRRTSGDQYGKVSVGGGGSAGSRDVKRKGAPTPAGDGKKPRQN